MKIIENSKPVPPECRNGAVAIGNFDGVHLGHQALLNIACEKAGELGCSSGLVTFEPHPRSLFRPDEPVFRLSTARWKARLVSGLGLDCMETVTFDRDLANLSPEEFVKRVLVERLGVSHVVTGYDFHFGHGRKGSPETMKQLGEELGFGVTIVDQVTGKDGLAPYSSSYIRTALRRGHVRAAASQLGYWWSIVGTVIEGDKRGREIGYPTLNIRLPEGNEPHEGIYAVRVRDADNPSQSWHGAGYIGYRPTFETSRLFLEVYLFDFEGDLYGRDMIVEFIDFIRPDMKFDGLDPLLEQMRADCEEIRVRLKAIDQDDPMTSFPLGRLQAEGKL